MAHLTTFIRLGAGQARKELTGHGLGGSRIKDPAQADSAVRAVYRTHVWKDRIRHGRHPLP